MDTLGYAFGGSMVLFTLEWTRLFPAFLSSLSLEVIAPIVLRTLNSFSSSSGPSSFLEMGLFGVVTVVAPGFEGLILILTFWPEAGEPLY
jgi:hypothetical protein